MNRNISKSVRFRFTIQTRYIWKCSVLLQPPPASKIVIASPRFSAGAAIPDAGLLHSLRSFAMTDDKSPSPAVSWLEETWRSDRLVKTSA